MTPDYDCIVIGAGGIGSAALYSLAKRGARVLGLEQYGIAHDKGSSHGDTRAIRLVYFEHPDYVPLLKAAYDGWERLEADSGKALFGRTGILQAGTDSGEVLSGLLAAANEHDLPMEQLSSEAANARFTGFDIPASDSAIFDPNGGILKVEECVRAFVDQAIRFGAEIEENASVAHWYRASGAMVVEAGDKRYSARRLVIAPGAWAPTLLPELAPHLQVLKKSLYWFEPENDCYHIENGFPVFLFERGGRTFYGFPALDEKGLKIAEHSGGKPIPNPAALDRHVETAELEAVTLALRQYLPRAGHQLNHHTTCMYTMSRDGHFMVGEYPGMPDVFVTAGLSGHGYKFASVLGEIMADLVMEGTTAHPIDFLSPSRFAGTGSQ